MHQPLLDWHSILPFAACVPLQTFWYRRLLIRDAAALQAMEAEAANQGKGTGAAAAVAAAAAANDDEGGGSGANAWRKLMNLVMQLRKVSNHPFMFPDSEPDGDGNSSLEQLLQASGERVRCFG